MIAIRFILAGAIALSGVSAHAVDDHLWTRALLKRQAPGTPAYNCHDNCGEAILEARNGGDICNDNIFLTDYKYCLQCAGPDNQDIWQFYGPSLTPTASGCGLSTTPLSGKQADVPPALPAASASTASSAAASSAVASSSTTSAEPSSAPAATTSTTTSSTEAISSSSSAAPSSAPGELSSVAASSTPAAAPSSTRTSSLITGTPISGGNSTNPPSVSTLVPSV
ncbi:hypothetical protein F5884DRAFT_525269 [Xylogone sp. PMI_703]|nr:hypothetical protein F5884DRAFT_525269 [Xylogone sp. PMI_703]